MILRRKRRAECPEIRIRDVKYLPLQVEKSVITGHFRSSNPAGDPKTRVGGANRSGSLAGFRSRHHLDDRLMGDEGHFFTNHVLASGSSLKNFSSIWATFSLPELLG